MNRMELMIRGDQNIANADALNSYLIFDCAHFDPSPYYELMNQPGIEVLSLFKNTVQEIETLELSPILIKLTEETPEKFIAQIRAYEKEYLGSILWLWSEMTISSLNNQLQKLLFAKLNGHDVLVRFYDSRCIVDRLKDFQRKAYTKAIIQNIPVWAFYSNEKYHYLWSTEESER